MLRDMDSTSPRRFLHPEPPHKNPSAKPGAATSFGQTSPDRTEILEPSP